MRRFVRTVTTIALAAGLTSGAHAGTGSDVDDGPEVAAAETIVSSGGTIRLTATQHPSDSAYVVTARLSGTGNVTAGFARVFVTGSAPAALATALAVTPRLMLGEITPAYAGAVATSQPQESLSLDFGTIQTPYQRQSSSTANGTSHLSSALAAIAGGPDAARFADGLANVLGTPDPSTACGGYRALRDVSGGTYAFTVIDTAGVSAQGASISVCGTSNGGGAPSMANGVTDAGGAYVSPVVASSSSIAGVAIDVPATPSAPAAACLEGDVSPCTGGVRIGF